MTNNSNIAAPRRISLPIRPAMNLATIVTAILTVYFTTTIAHAQGNGPGFHVSANGDANCPGGQTLSSATPPALLGPLAIPCTSGQGIAAAEAGASSLRAKGRSEHTCCGTASGGNGSARIQIENVVISGPNAASIPISLNFRLKGTLTGNTDFGQNSLFLFVGLSGFNTTLSSFSQLDANHVGIFNKTGVFAPLTLSFPTATIDQTFATPVTNAAPNQPLRLEVQLHAGTAMAGIGSTETDFFSNGNGLFLPIGTPVFNLPPGYTINIPELNVVNNFVQLPPVVNGDIFIVGTNASEISLPGVTQVTGSVTVSNNTAAGSIDLNSLQTVGGSVSVSNNTAAGSIDLNSLVTVGGSISIDGNASATVIDTGSLQSVGGSISIDDNGATIIDTGSLQSVGGSISIDGNASATVIDTGSLQSVGGSLIIDGDDSLIILDLGELTTAGGSIAVNDDDSLTTLDLGELTTAGGSISINNDPSLTSVDLSSLATANGDVTVVNNGPCTNVIIGAVTTVIGNLTVASCGTGSFTLGSASPGGNAVLTTSGYSSISGTTAVGSTTIRNATGEASMTVQLPAHSFTTPVSFSLTHLDPVSLLPEPGVNANNAPAIIDPVTAYQITFGVPTLNQNAMLSFDVFLSGLDPATANALLAALANGSATLVTRGDAAGSQYQAFPICGTGQQPTAGGCVLVELLDANGQPTTGTPAILRFSNVVGHFSTWAVAIVTPQSNPTNSFNGLLSPYPAPPHTTTPTFKRGSVVPLKFNWVNAAGLIVDSAAANPSVAVSPTSCTTQTPSTTPITAEDAGNSGGLRYDANTKTWIFNWSTRALVSGCFVVRVTTSNATMYATPAGNFPIALRDR